MLDQTYNTQLRKALIGRKLMEDAMPTIHRGRPMFTFWGEDLGFASGDVHKDRAYRIYLDYNRERIVTDVDVVVEGDLISPCAGFFPESLDEFDFRAVLEWCLKRTETGTSSDNC